MLTAGRRLGGPELAGHALLVGVPGLAKTLLARTLARLMRGPLYHVNLIPYNSTPDAAIRGSDDARIWAFGKVLEQAGAAVTVRTPMGRDIAAACGQLRAETQPKAHAAS